MQGEQIAVVCFVCEALVKLTPKQHREASQIHAKVICSPCMDRRAVRNVR